MLESGEAARLPVATEIRINKRMEGVKRCFVICPIGEAKSDVRHAADDVLELLIEPALEIFGFTVIRADKIVGSGQINSEVIELVQNAELCIVDLTGSNPNVFYECGRRHETAKPFIQLIRQGDDLPFDLAGVRTLEYDLTNPRTTRMAIQEIRRHVQSLEDSGYASSTSGVSTVTLAQAIDRIERKVDRLSISGYGSGTPTAVAGNVLPSGLLSADALRNPDEVFMTAIATGNLDNALSAFRTIRRITGNTQRVIAYAGVLCVQGIEDAAIALKDILSSDRALELEEDDYEAAISGLVRFYVRTDREAEGVNEVASFVKPKLVADIDPTVKAYYHNQLQMMYYGAKQFEQALEHSLKSLDLAPEKTAYMYNASLIYEAMDMIDDAERMVDEFMGAEDTDADHLGQAIDIYAKRDRFDDVRSTFAKLVEIDPGKAAVKSMFDENLRRIING